MRNYETRERTVRIENTKSITCDFCGTTYDYNDTLEVQEFVHIDYFGGYGSVLGDGLELDLDMCQHCLLKLVQKQESGEFKV